MGWDIHVGTEYKDFKTGKLVPADDYIVYHTVEGETCYEICEPIAEFRNYNLFRPLAGVRNTKKAIDWQHKELNDYLAQHNRLDYDLTGRFIDDYRPETDGPTAVLCKTPLTEQQKDQHCDVIRRAVFDRGYEDAIYACTLEQLCKFCRQHVEYHKLWEFKEKAAAKYARANEVYKASQCVDNPVPLSKSDFWIVFSFDY